MADVVAFLGVGVEVVVVEVRAQVAVAGLGVGEQVTRIERPTATMAFFLPRPAVSITSRVAVTSLNPSGPA